jgi:hypothetical protein
MVTTERQLKSPVRKLLPFFQKSRDQWKVRHHDLQARLKKEQNQVRAVEKSRANWRLRAEAVEREQARLAAEISALKERLTTFQPNTSN